MYVYIKSLDHGEKLSQWSRQTIKKDHAFLYVLIHQNLWTKSLKDRTKRDKYCFIDESIWMFRPWGI